MPDGGLIDKEAELRSLADRLRGVDVVAVDTEFVRERTYSPRPCLLQLAWDEQVACIDLLTLGRIDALDELFFGDRVQKVFHAARQDLELFFGISGRVPAPVYDTQIAGALLGFPDQAGYGQLVQDILGVGLDKGHARTDWSRRPLRDDQLRYAIDDVRYLLPMRQALEERLAARGRQGWIVEMFDELTDPSLYAPDPRGAWRRVKNWRQLEGPALARLQALAAWREEQAVERDRPRRWILGDDALIELARRNPLTEQAMADTPIPRSVARRQGRAIARRLSGVGDDAQPYEVPPDRRLTRSQTRLVSSLGRLVDATAEREQVAASILATRAELRALVAGERGLRVLRGWRRELVGAELLAIVEEAPAQAAGSEGTSTDTSRS